VLIPKQDLSKFSFGITSAIVTSLALMLGLDTLQNAKSSIIGALLIIAVADNISDSLGIHVYKESLPIESKTDPWVFTITNFLTRLGVMVLFIVLVLTLPLNVSAAVSIAFGLTLLSVMSYYIGVQQKINPAKSVVEHLVIAIIVIIASHFLGQLIGSTFKV
jgi:VIT1/CCC1 family predicted Fe2+/Mn2+ transporter